MKQRRQMSRTSWFSGVLNTAELMEKRSYQVARRYRPVYLHVRLQTSYSHIPIFCHMTVSCLLFQYRLVAGFALGADLADLTTLPTAALVALAVGLADPTVFRVLPLVSLASLGAFRGQDTRDPQNQFPDSIHDCLLSPLGRGAVVDS